MLDKLFFSGSQGSPGPSGGPAIRGSGEERFAGLGTVPGAQTVNSAPVHPCFGAVIEQGTDPEPDTFMEPASVPALLGAGTGDRPEKKSR